MKTKNKNSEILQITQIKIKLPNKELELSADEARKVYEELGKLFEKEKIVPEKEYVPYPYPYPVPYYPIIIEKQPPEPYWTYPQIWCGTNPELGKTTCLSIDLTNKTV